MAKTFIIKDETPDMEVERTSSICPHCFQRLPTDVQPEWLLDGLKSNTFSFTLIKLLLKAREKRQGLSLQDIYKVWYESVKTKTTESVPVTDALASRIYDLNTKLKKSGWQIVGPKQTGKGYFLVPLV